MYVCKYNTQLRSSLQQPRIRRYVGICRKKRPSSTSLDPATSRPRPLDPAKSYAVRPAWLFLSIMQCYHLVQLMVLFSGGKTKTTRCHYELLAGSRSPTDFICDEMARGGLVASDEWLGLCRLGISCWHDIDVGWLMYHTTPYSWFSQSNR